MTPATEGFIPGLGVEESWAIVGGGIGLLVMVFIVILVALVTKTPLRCAFKRGENAIAVGMNDSDMPLNTSAASASSSV